MEKIALKDVQNLVKSMLRRAELVQQAKGWPPNIDCNFMTFSQGSYFFLLFKLV